MGLTLELFELESNPAGKLSVTMSKGPSCITTGSRLLPQLSQGPRES